jgi:hypothetical protein
MFPKNLFTPSGNLLVISEPVQLCFGNPWSDGCPIRSLIWLTHITYHLWVWLGRAGPVPDVSLHHIYAHSIFLHKDEYGQFFMGLCLGVDSLRHPLYVGSWFLLYRIVGYKCIISIENNVWSLLCTPYPSCAVCVGMRHEAPRFATPVIQIFL